MVLLVTLLSVHGAHAGRPIVHLGPLTVSMRDGEGIPPEHASSDAKRTQPPKGDRVKVDPRTGNNYEAALQSTGCQEFLATYLPQEVSFGNAKLYLKLVADADAELALEDGVELREYRGLVDIAYLIVSVDRAAWDAANERFRKSLCSMFMPMLRSLYPKASLYVTDYDGQIAVANSNRKLGSRAPAVAIA